MTDQFYSDITFIIIATVIAAFLGFLIGWLMRNVRLNSLKKSLETCYESNERLKQSLDNQEKFEPSIHPISSTQLPASTAPSMTVVPPSLNLDEAKGIFKKVIRQDDLKIVEGIGPKIEELLQQDGIKTWSQLGNVPVSRLQTILKNAGDRFSFHKPNTWPKQASLAAQGNWKELKALQDHLKGGRPPK